MGRPRGPATGRPIAHVAKDLGIHKEALRGWVRQVEADTGERDDRLTTAEREELEQLRRENAELRRANETSHAPLVSSGLAVRDGCRVREGYCLAI
ncbi:transposase, partial [Streptomyces sp. NPDC093984]|uniref:transposase n=1 Tax=Streptomyces sp. NPDC093984 TaxID=3366052 RepID=UPI0038059DCD